MLTLPIAAHLPSTGAIKDAKHSAHKLQGMPRTLQGELSGAFTAAEDRRQQSCRLAQQAQHWPASMVTPCVVAVLCASLSALKSYPTHPPSCRVIRPRRHQLPQQVLCLQLR